jgi:hypothetical protein
MDLKEFFKIQIIISVIFVTKVFSLSVGFVCDILNYAVEYIYFHKLM